MLTKISHHFDGQGGYTGTGRSCTCEANNGCGIHETDVSHCCLPSSTPQQRPECTHHGSLSRHLCIVEPEIRTWLDGCSTLVGGLLSCIPTHVVLDPDLKRPARAWKSLSVVAERVLQWHRLQVRIGPVQPLLVPCSIYTTHPGGRQSGHTSK